MYRHIYNVLAILLLLINPLFGQEKQIKPELISWHNGISIEKIAFSNDGQYLLTLGDGDLVITDLRKRIPLKIISGVTDLVETKEPAFFYTVSDADKMFNVSKYAFETGSITAEFKFPTEIKERGQTWTKSSPIAIDPLTNEFVIPYTTLSGSLIVVFNQEGKVVKSMPIANETRINAVIVDNKQILVLTTEGLYQSKDDQLQKVLSPEAGNHFANMKVENDHMVLMSNKNLQWVDKNTLKSTRTVSVTQFFAQNGQFNTAGIVQAQHPFQVDNEGSAWLVDTRISQIDRNAPPPPEENQTYQIARINTEITYPLKSSKRAISISKETIDPVFAYNKKTDLFAFVEHSGFAKVIICHREHGELFRIGQRNLQFVDLHFTKTPGKIFLRTGEELDDLGFFLDLGTGRLETVKIFDDGLYYRNRRKFTRFASAESFENIFIPQETRFYNAEYLTDKNEKYLLTNVGHNNKQDTLKLTLPNGFLYFSKENGHVAWKNEKKVTTSEIFLKTVDKKPIRFFENYFQKYHYDSVNSKLLISYRSDVTTHGLQFMIDVKNKKLIKQARYNSPFIMLKDGKTIINSEGLFSNKEKEDSVIARFPDSYRPRIFNRLGPVVSRDERHIIYQDQNNRLISFVVATKQVLLLGVLPDLKELYTDPHSSNIFSLGENGVVKVWRPDVAGELATIVLQGRLGSKTSKDIQPSYLVITPEGYYLGENRFYEMFRLQEGFKQYPPFLLDWKFNRPDKVFDKLGYGNTAFIEKIKPIVEKRASRKVENVKSDVFISNKNQLPYFNTTGSIELEATCSGTLTAGETLMVYVNGTALWSPPGQKANGTMKVTTDLVDAVNLVRVCLRNKDGSETPGDFLYVNSTEAAKKNLYVISIGVSEYKDSRHNLKYAEKDATEVVTRMKRLFEFGEVKTKEFYNAQATSLIVSGIGEFLKGCRSEDEIIVFYAGHGLLDKQQNFYLATHDMDFADPSKKGIFIDNLVAAISGSRSRNKILMIDACNSGLIDDMKTTGDIVQGDNDEAKAILEKRGADLEIDAKQNFSAIYFTFKNFDPGTGVNILAAAAGNEAALEGGGLRNGLFTFGLLSAMETGLADYDQNDEITLNEVQLYIRDFVETKSRGAQRPSFRQANIYQDPVLMKKNETGFGTFLYGVQSNMVDVVENNLKSNADYINQRDAKDFTALQYSCREGYYDMTRLLVKYGAKINFPETEPLPPVFLAAVNGHLQVLYWLMTSGADASMLSKSFFMPRIKDKNILDLILNFDAIKAKQEKQSKFLQILSKNLDEAISIYDQGGIDLNQWQILEGTSPVFSAVSPQNDAVLKWLIKKKVDVNLRAPEYGYTPLMVATYIKSNVAVKFLLDNGANKDLKDNYGKTALDYAKEAGNTEAMALLN